MATIAAGTSSTLYIPIAQSLTITPGTSGKASINGRNQDGSAITPQEIYAATTIALRAGATITVDAINVDAACTDVADSLSSVSGGGAALAGQEVIAFIGDSITANGVTTTSPQVIGYSTWAMVLTGKRFATAKTLNFGVVGDTTTQILARIDAAIVTARAAGVTAFVELSGTNDAGALIDPATIMANRQLIWRKILDAGFGLTVGTILPRSDGGVGANVYKIINGANRILHSIAPLWPMRVWDGHRLLLDHSSTTGAVVTAATITADQLHPNQAGAYWLGKDLAAVLDQQYPRRNGGRYASTNPSESYDATYNPNGNRLANAGLTGTGGTNAGAYATGSVATSWTVFRASGSTITCVSSKGTKAVGNGQTVATQILTISSPGGGANGEIINFQQIMTIPEGSTVIAGAGVTVSAVTGNVMAVGCRAQIQYNSFSVLSEDMAGAGLAGAPIPEGYSGQLENFAAVTPAGGTSVLHGVTVNCNCQSAVSVVVEVVLPYFRTI